MADDIVYITFDNDKIGANLQGSTPQNNAFVNGTLEFDYSTNEVTGTYQLTGDVTQTTQIKIGGAIQSVNGNISFTDGNLSLNFSGEQPTQANQITYKINRSDPYPQYSTSNEPTPLLTSSTTAPCFCSGTLIRTSSNDVTVEKLAIGDLVMTASGALRPIRWIGHRAYTGRFANANPDLLPICIKAGAIADGLPSRDLRVSPKHAMFIDGVLIPAASLVNGTSIVKIERVDELTYWHVELDGHDVLLAEDAPAESFVNDDGRNIFQNAHTFRALYPDAAEPEAVYCAPRVESGHRLADVRRRLNARAGCAVSAVPAFGMLLGHLDECAGLRVRGWARDEFYPDAPVCLDILVDGDLVALTYADTYRPDLAAAGIGDGHHGFALDLPLQPGRAHVIAVRRSADGATLTGSPWQVPAVDARVA